MLVAILHLFNTFSSKFLNRQNEKQKMKIWIDLTNSPHVNFFAGMINWEVK